MCTISPGTGAPRTTNTPFGIHLGIRAKFVRMTWRDRLGDTNLIPHTVMASRLRVMCSCVTKYVIPVPLVWTRTGDSEKGGIYRCCTTLNHLSTTSSVSSFSGLFTAPKVSLCAFVNMEGIVADLECSRTTVRSFAKITFTNRSIKDVSGSKGTVTGSSLTDWGVIYILCRIGVVPSLQLRGQLPTRHERIGRPLVDVGR